MTTTVVTPPAREPKRRNPRPARSELAPPPGRQGPGPIVDGLVDAIDLLVVRLVARGMPGEMAIESCGRNQLAQLRAYQTGDDVRHLDAAATARTGQPHVRLHVPNGH